MPQAVPVGLFWILTSAFYSSSANTWFLTEMKSSIAHNLTRFLGASLMCLLISLFTPYTKIRLDKVKIMAAPTVFMVCANIANSIALESVGVTLTYVIKASIPVWTCAYLFFFEGKRFSLPICCSLLMCCVGVAMAVMGDFGFNWIGFGAACTSCLMQVAFNLCGKPAMAKAELTDKPMQGYATSVAIGTGLALVLYQFEAVLGLRSLEKGVFTTALGGLTASPIDLHTPMLLVHATVSYFLEYGTNFVFLPLVSPVAFSITDIVRRVSTIGINAILFGKVLTPMNIAGVVISLGGALFYSLQTKAENSKKAEAKID